jgi:hypothetical protein
MEETRYNPCIHIDIDIPTIDIPAKDIHNFIPLISPQIAIAIPVMIG